MIELQVGGLGFDPKSMSPIVLLRDQEERNFLPIWIGMFEAAAIAMELQSFKTPRPMTHDLLANTIMALGAKAEKVVITHIVENTFYSEISLIKDGNLLVLDSRPSDSIAIAVRLDIPIYVSESVMSTAKMVNVEKDEKEAQKFKDFIDNINPDDFKKHLGND